MQRHFTGYYRFGSAEFQKIEEIQMTCEGKCPFLNGAPAEYATSGVQIWRSRSVQFQAQEVDASPVGCLCHEALIEWHLGEISSCLTTIAEAISLAKELNDMHGLAVALSFAAILAHAEGNLAEVERRASDLIELSTRQNFSFWLALGSIQRGWARSASGNTTEGISWIQDGIRDYRATGSMLCLPYFLALKAEALHIANRTSEVGRDVHVTH